MNGGDKHNGMSPLVLLWGLGTIVPLWIGLQLHDVGTPLLIYYGGSLVLLVGRLMVKQHFDL